MRKYLFIFIFVLVCYIIPANAETFSHIEYFKQNTLVDLKSTCDDSGAFCSSDALCNITIIYPSSEIFVNNEPMSYNTAFFNYTLSDSSVLGEYRATVQCIDGSANGLAIFNFVINPSGREDQNNMLSLVFAFIVVIIYLTLMGYWIKQPYISFASYFFAGLELIFIISIQYFTYLGGWLDNLLAVNFYSMMLVFFGITFYKLFELVITMVADTNSDNENNDDKFDKKW